MLDLYIVQTFTDCTSQFPVMRATVLMCTDCGKVVEIEPVRAYLTTYTGINWLEKILEPQYQRCIRLQGEIFPFVKTFMPFEQFEEYVKHHIVER